MPAAISEYILGSRIIINYPAQNQRWRRIHARVINLGLANRAISQRALFSAHVRCVQLGCIADGIHACFPSVSSVSAADNGNNKRIGSGSDTHRIVVIPENVGGRLWTLQDDAREIDGATTIDEQVRRTQNLRFRLWKVKNCTIPFIMPLKAIFILARFIVHCSRSNRSCAFARIDNFRVVCALRAS